MEANETTARSEDAEQQSEGAQQSLASAPQEKPRADIQAALDVLRRRQEDLVSEEYRMELDLRETNLTGASLSKAILTGANLSRAGLYEANLREANLYEANLTGADLYGANLREANLVESQGLTQEQLEEALGDDNTKLPEGLHLPASWLEA